MDKINKVLICGLGGVGCVCAAAIEENKSAELKILVDEARYDFYKSNPTQFNSKTYEFKYILPTEKSFFNKSPVTKASSE